MSKYHGENVAVKFLCVLKISSLQILQKQGKQRCCLQYILKVICPHLNVLFLGEVAQLVLGPTLSTPVINFVGAFILLRFKSLYPTSDPKLAFCMPHS